MYRMQHTGCRTQDHGTLDTGPWIQDAECRIQDTRYSILGTRCRLGELGDWKKGGGAVVGGTHSGALNTDQMGTTNLRPRRDPYDERARNLVNNYIKRN